MFKSFSRYKINQILYILSFLLILSGSLGHFFHQPYFKYVFAAGAVLVLLNHLYLMFKTQSPDFRQKRLLRINLFLSMLLVLAAYSMFDGTTLWIVALLIYALVTLMLSFRNQ